MRFYGNWYFYGKFYAISPMLGIIQSGLKLITTEAMSVAPYETKKVNMLMMLKEMMSVFLTWTQPVPETVPLYLNISKWDIIPKF